MQTRKGRQVQERTSNWQAGVKPWGAGAKADVWIANQNSERLMFDAELMEAICERENLKTALRRVQQNQGSPGVDGMTVDELPAYLKAHWLEIKEQLLKGTYPPRPIKRIEVPKPGSRDKRKLGIPCVIDRFIQQAILQVLQGPWDETFSEHSYGFRPGRSAHQAIGEAQAHIKAGYGIVVDIDLEKFFDQICHDHLMSKLAQRMADKRLLKLIRAYLQAGILENGLISRPREGSVQGGPLSPFLSNVVLDELDKELEARGHRFTRYADDCNIYVKSERAGQRVMASVSRFITQRLKLKVNTAKSAVDKPQNRTFLGFSFTGGKAPNRRKIAPASIQRFKTKVRSLTRRNSGVSLQKCIEKLAVYLKGWRGYYGYGETATVLRDLDSWIRRRLRCVIWKQWKGYGKRKKELIRRGVGEKLAHSSAWSAKGPWSICHTPAVRIALNNQYFDALGLPRLAPQ